jgi:acetylornithine deacetylase
MRLAVLAIVLYRLIGLARSEQVALLSPHGYEEAELSRLHQQMVEIQSISGDEHAIGEFLHSYLKTHNYSVELQRVGHRRFNVLAYRGSERNTKILLTSHIDTVRLA